MTYPRATMRLQFHRGFTFSDAAALIPYFTALGISHVYASPVMTARPGSMHGYDVIDPTRVNPELGGEDELRRLVGALRRHGMGLIVDIVPNHMAIGSGNRWWMDVLSRGRSSSYAKFFDIDWDPPNSALRGKVLLPVLGRPYGEALDAGEITFAADASGSYAIHYFDHRFPVTVDGGDPVDGGAESDFDGRTPAGRERLHCLLEHQHYRLAWWRFANDEINWRRFFDINELIALRMEDDDVFETVHATLFRLYAEGLIDGVRVDHIDGLAQPERYCRSLRARLRALERERPPESPRGDPYLVVEKILAGDESLPASWETDGTTGYDFMDQVSALQHEADGEPVLRALWQAVSGRPGDFDAEEEMARRQVLARSFSAQCDAVVEAFYRIAQGDLTTRDFSRAAIRRGLTEILAHFPVYRIYAEPGHASVSDRNYLHRAIAGAKTTCLRTDLWLIDILGQWLSGRRILPDSDRGQAIALIRFEQLSAPLCAKSVEDTAFFRYGRLISRNDVGFDAHVFACPVTEFHRKMQDRAAALPHAMLATATHDHKRGEDVRARLAVLSELAQDWAQSVERWLALSAPHCTINGGVQMPAPGDLAILFQSLVGAWPLALAPHDRTGLRAYADRIAAWQQKALREAKLHTDWSAPDDSYERAAADFITWLFFGPSDLLAEIADFARRIAPAGAANGLAQTLVKLTAPGVPDIYQGTDYWDLSLVDPDNRAPVDFAVRQSSINATAADKLADDWLDGRVKQSLIRRVLAVRKEKAELFSRGAYLPLAAEGPLADHIVAFARFLDKDAVISVFCRNIARFLARDGTFAVPSSRWSGTRLIIPGRLCGSFSDALQQEAILVSGSEISIDQILRRLPVAFLIYNQA